MRPSILLTTTLLAATALSPARAGPSQASITSPGGLANACAAEVSAATGFTPGGEA